MQKLLVEINNHNTTKVEHPAVGTISNIVPIELILVYFTHRIINNYQYLTKYFPTPGSVLALNASIDAPCPEKCRPKEHKDWIYCWIEKLQNKKNDLFLKDFTIGCFCNIYRFFSLSYFLLQNKSYLKVQCCTGCPKKIMTRLQVAAWAPGINRTLNLYFILFSLI